MYAELVSKDEALSKSLVQESANTKASLQAQEVKLNVQAGQIGDIQERHIASDNKRKKMLCGLQSNVSNLG